MLMLSMIRGKLELHSPRRERKKLYICIYSKINKIIIIIMIINGCGNSGYIYRKLVSMQNAKVITDKEIK